MCSSRMTWSIKILGDLTTPSHVENHIKDRCILKKNLPFGCAVSPFILIASKYVAFTTYQALLRAAYELILETPL